MHIGQHYRKMIDVFNPSYLVEASIVCLCKQWLTWALETGKRNAPQSGWLLPTCINYRHTLILLVGSPTARSPSIEYVCFVCYFEIQSTEYSVNGLVPYQKIHIGAGVGIHSITSAVFAIKPCQVGNASSELLLLFKVPKFGKQTILTWPNHLVANSDLGKVVSHFI